MSIDEDMLASRCLHHQNIHQPVGAIASDHSHQADEAVDSDVQGQAAVEAEGNLAKLIFLTLVALQLPDYPITLSAKLVFFEVPKIDKSSLNFFGNHETRNCSVHRLPQAYQARRRSAAKNCLRADSGNS